MYLHLALSMSCMYKGPRIVVSPGASKKSGPALAIRPWQQASSLYSIDWETVSAAGGSYPSVRTCKGIWLHLACDVLMCRALSLRRCFEATRPGRCMHAWLDGLSGVVGKKIDANGIHCASVHTCYRYLLSVSITQSNRIWWRWISIGRGNHPFPCRAYEGIS